MKQELEGWEPGCYYKIDRDLPVGVSEWGVTDDMGTSNYVIPRGTIFLLKGIIDRLVTLGGDDGIEVTTANQYLRFFFIDPRFPGERRVRAYDKNWGMRKHWQRGFYDENDLGPTNKITSPLFMLALVEAGLAWVTPAYAKQSAEPLTAPGLKLSITLSC